MNTVALMDVAFHQLTSRRNPEAYLRTCKNATDDPQWIASMLDALEYVRTATSVCAVASGEKVRLCSCCKILRPVDNFRVRIDRRRRGAFTVATCGDCERGYCRNDSGHRSSVKQGRILRLREEKLASEDPEFAAAVERTRKQYLSRMAHEFFCGCADCDGEA
jgi:hypothetical protein